MHNSETWKLTSVYGPCTEPARLEFVSWFRGHEIEEEEDWLFIGDFNFYRSMENRNRLGGNLHDTLLFNDAIGHLGLVELPLKCRAYTWSNMQQNPLLEQLDWFFTSVNWTNIYRMTEVIPLAKVTSDDIPCKIMINTTIPRSNLFRFENYWTEHNDYYSVVQDSWSQSELHPDSASNLAAKLKRLRYALKAWSKSLSNLNQLINNCNTVILFLDTLEDRRSLFNTEADLRKIVKEQMARLLHFKQLYWKKRYTVNRIKLGDECTKFFHAMATISFRRNSISQPVNNDGATIQDHAGKADLMR